MPLEGRGTEYRWARVIAMDHRELLYRIRQELAKRWDLTCYRLKIGFDNVQLTEPRWRPAFFFSSDELPELISQLRRHFPYQAQQIVERANRICRHRFDLLGYKDLDYGARVDWHKDVVHGKRAPKELSYRIQFLNFSKVGDVKIIWELNRHQHLVTLAKAFLLSGDERFATELCHQWDDWRAQNPYPIGVNWTSSLEVAFRSLSWLWVYHLTAGCPVVPEDFRRQVLLALGVHGRHIERYLSTYFSANTHLLGEGVALFFLGTLCPELPRASKWQSKGWEIVLHQAERQVQSDGMHFEQSTYYHVYALDFLLHARILAGLNGISIPARLDSTLERMLEALMEISQAGMAPRFGDDDGGRVFDPSRNRAEHMLDPLATGAALFNRDDFRSVAGGLREETLWLLGPRAIETFERIGVTKPHLRSVRLEASGICVMTSPGPVPGQLIVDAGIQGYGTAGHSHADALSVQLSADGRSLLPDLGTFQYVGEERNVFRGTGAHNTLRVDGEDQARASGPFRWTRLPTVEVERWIVADGFDFFAGRQYGQPSASAASVHHRYIFSLKNRFWLIRDLVTGTGTRHLEIAWHLGPHLALGDGAEHVFRAVDGSTGLALLPATEHRWSRELCTEGWSPAYGRKKRIPVLRFSSDTTLPAEFAMLLILMPSKQSLVGKLTKLQDESEGASVSGYRYREPEEDHLFFFASDRQWHSGPWSSDAEFLHYRMAPTSKARAIIMANASYINFAGQRVVTCERAVTQCEIRLNGAGVQVVSEQRDLVALHQPLFSLPAELDSISMSTQLV